MLAKGLKIHKEVNEWAAETVVIDPVLILGCRKGPFGPGSVAEAESYVIGQAIVLEQELSFFASDWAINVIWATPTEDFIPALGENTFVARGIGPASELVIVGKLGVAEDLWSDAKERLDSRSMFGDLVGKFITIIEKGKGVIIGFADDFGLTPIYHALDLGDELGSPFFGLVEPGTGNAEGYLEAGTFLHVLFEQIEHRTIAFICNFPKDALIALATVVLIMEIVGIIAYVKNRVLSIADRLMDM